MYKAINPIWQIYALCEPKTREIKYVGKSINVKNRLSWHLAMSKAGRTKKDKWIKALVEIGLCPKIKIIAETQYENEAILAEIDEIRIRNPEFNYQHKPKRKYTKRRAKLTALHRTPKQLAYVASLFKEEIDTPKP